MLLKILQEGKSGTEGVIQGLFGKHFLGQDDPDQGGQLSLVDLPWIGYGFCGSKRHQEEWAEVLWRAT